MKRIKCPLCTGITPTTSHEICREHSIEILKAIKGGL